MFSLKSTVLLTKLKTDPETDCVMLGIDSRRTPSAAEGW